MILKQLLTVSLSLLPLIASANRNNHEALQGTSLESRAKGNKKFKITHTEAIEYFESLKLPYLEKRDNPPLLDLNLVPIREFKWDEVTYTVRPKTKTIFTLDRVNPHSISGLFKINPEAYNQMYEAEDFFSAKQKAYSKINFDLKKFSYDKKFFQFEDWRSLNHPPIREVGADLTIWDKTWTPDLIEVRHPVYHSADFHKKIDDLSDSELSFGNQLELLENGDAYRRKISEIGMAKESVLMAVMSFICDKTSRDLENAMIQKVKEGVDVKLMLEKVWSKIASNSCVNRMQRAGVDVVFANDFLKKGEKSALFHNKFMIIDGKIVIMGGTNIILGDNISTGDNHMNRDNDVFAQGPVATDATLTFVDLWKNFAKRKNTKNLKKDHVRPIEYYEEKAKQQRIEELAKAQRGRENYESQLNDDWGKDNGVCRFLTQDPRTDKFRLSKVFIEYINNAQTKLNMTNGSNFEFELPTDSERSQAKENWNKRLFDSIFAATDRGAKLDIIGNAIDGGFGEASTMFHYLFLKNRNKFISLKKEIGHIISSKMDRKVAKNAQPYLEYLAQQDNVRAWAHFQYMHAKKFQFDHLVSVISSYNLETWSADKSHESAIICMDRNLNAQMQKSFVLDIANSVPAYDPESNFDTK